MEYVLKNDRAEARFRTYGGELTAFYVDGVNYIWNGDEAFWKYHAPTLFPVVCKLNGSEFAYEGTRYKLPNHGFARVMEHNMLFQDENRIVFSLSYSFDTLISYPFKFHLKTEYILEGASLSVKYIVENLDDKEMYFSIGGHTAFMCPFAGGTYKDYYLQFSQKETASRFVCDEDGLLRKDKLPYLNDEDTIYVEQKDIIIDTIMLENLKSNKVSLKSKNSDRFIQFDFSGFPYIAFWSPKEEAPFLCIEPWFGMPDMEGFTGNINEKLGILNLGPNKKFECRQVIEIL